MTVYESVWDALAKTPEEAAAKKARANLMHKLRGHIAENDWTRAEAAAELGVARARIDDLLCGKMSRFTIDDMTAMANNAGIETNR